jgi:hypothetical protein
MTPNSGPTEWSAGSMPPAAGALQSSRTIGSAIGMIMASGHIGPEVSVTILEKVSQDSHPKLRELAHDLVASSAQD